MHDEFHPGQRWISESEPELGLGSIVQTTARRVVAQFAAAGERREYASANAPLRRVRFRIGDSIRNREDRSFIVDGVSERHGLVFYRSNGAEISESDLSDAITFNEPQERLFAGQSDPPQVFNLRFAALEHQCRQRKSRVRGFAGGRVELIPHQLYIASEVAGRLAPRVLLADEVGLGKTIEACLILHRLILTGRATRVLIMVPESLVHQWFVELLRRFNLWFHIFDEERCQSIASRSPGENPFLDDQLVLCSIGLFTRNEERSGEALSAGWDILVIDEAHHLAWSPEKVSPEYALVEELCRKTPGLLLLTATPDQLGIAGHFARLRLLDPDRFYDLKEFINETEHYREIARRAEQLEDDEQLAALLDQHGTGRVVFRNTRATIKGFPNRIPHLTQLNPASSKNARLDWLATLLIGLAPAKVLLICRTQAGVAAIENALRQRVKNIQIAIFHEGLTLIQRDRNAAWFADPHGARILICSEIGSEGRNFQFAHHLVLFDLPLDPELLEQRIGRLDRIGQTADIHIHVSFASGSSMEVLARWYHEGLNAFATNIEGGGELLERFGARVYDLAQRFAATKRPPQDELAGLIEETQQAHRSITEQLQQGRDRLLELNSFRPVVAANLVHEIEREDVDRSLDEFMLSVFDHYHLAVEELAPRTYKLGSAGILTDAIPGIPAEGLTVTCDRRRALMREDIQFLTWDHPLVTGVLDLLLGSEKGNCCFVSAPGVKAGLYLEAVYVLECVAPAHLHADRFLPPTPLRIVVDQSGNDAQKSIPLELPSQRLSNDEVHAILEESQTREKLIPALSQTAGVLAGAKIPAIVQQSQKEMNAQLEHEIGRLHELRKLNPSVRIDEIELLIEQREALRAHLASARVRLDSLRLIVGSLL